MAAVDYFLKIDGIEGESKADKHTGEIDLESFSWGATQSGSFATGGGGGSGKVSMQDFHFTMGINKAGPALFLACAQGDHIPKAVLTCRKAGKEQQEFLKVSLEPVDSCRLQSHATNMTINSERNTAECDSFVSVTSKRQFPRPGVGLACGRRLTRTIE